MYDDPHILNPASLVDAAYYADARYYGRDVVLVHSTRRQRSSSWDAVLSRLSKGNIATFAVGSRSYVPLLVNLHMSLQRQQVSNYFFVALDEDTFFELSKVMPFRVVLLDGLDEPAHVRMRKKVKRAWHSSITRAKFQVLLDLLEQGFSAFALDADVYVQKNYVPALSVLPNDAFYAASAAIASFGRPTGTEWVPRYVFDGGVVYVPWSSAAKAFLKHLLDEFAQTRTASASAALDAVAACTSVDTCVWDKRLKLRVLPPLLFTNGATFVNKQWPHRAALSDALLIHHNAGHSLPSKMFHLAFSGHWHHSVPIMCANYSSVTGKPMTLNTTTLDQVLERHARFFTFVRKHRIQCAILPALQLPQAQAQLPFDTIFDFHAVAQYTRANLLHEHGMYVSTNSTAVPFEVDETPGGQFAYTRQNAHASLRKAAAHFAKEHLPESFHCVVDNERSAEEVALLALRQQLQRVANMAQSLAGNSNKAREFWLSIVVCAGSSIIA